MRRVAVLPPGKPVFFASAGKLRAWLERHHQTAQELWVGFYRKSTGKPTITWPELVDECLCFGWIDGIRRGIDDERYTNRITPRRPGSNWSAINIRRVGELAALGRMTDAGRRAFEARDEARSRVYSYDRENPPAFTPAQARQLRTARAAWKFFQAQSPSYRNLVTHWVVSARREETQAKRLASLIEDCAAGRRIAALAPRKTGS
jgi:uncharacterized protein YdeI (YjbR/CyaY-like superfamily)